MPIEIERRFLIGNDNWRQYADEPLLLRQGYLSVEKERTVRVRIAGKRAWLTLKGYIRKSAAVSLNTKSRLPMRKR